MLMPNLMRCAITDCLILKSRIFQKLSCPNCGAKLDAEDNLDELFCNYCGYKIVLDDDARRTAKIRMKEIEAAQRMKDIEADVSRLGINTIKTRSILN